MASITLTRGNTLPDSSAKSDFHNLVDQASAAITNIVNADVSGSAAIAASKLDLSSVGQKIIMTSKAIDYAQGSNIASATTTDIGAATGNFIDVTGTTTITGLGTIQAGSIRFVRFTGILTLTHNGTSLILPTAANITTAANDRAIFVSLGSGNWLCLAYQRADGTALVDSTATLPAGTVVQVVNVLDNVHEACNTALPSDNTTPQNDEGTEVMTLAITPTNASNKLKIDVVACVNHGAASSGITGAALFQDSTAGALCAQGCQGQNGDDTFVIAFTYFMDAGTTSSTTFKVRVGSDTGNADFNGDSSARFYGAAQYSSITITEIKV